MTYRSGKFFSLFPLVCFFFEFATLCFAADSVSSHSSFPTFPLTIPTSTTTSASQTHTITVGNGDHKFHPDVVQAVIGDIIEFTFYPANHSVVRAEYEFPCIPYEMTGLGKRGFFSDFHPVDAVLPSPASYSIRVNDTTPVFFYCSAPGSCITYGMVGVINPNATTSLTHQRTLALDSAYMLQPGEPFPAEGSTPSTPSSTDPTSALESAATTRRGGKHGLSGGAIAGISIGAISLVTLGALLCFHVGRSRTLRQEMVRKSSTIRHTTLSSPSSLPFDPHHGGQPLAPHYNIPDSVVDYGTGGEGPGGKEGGGMARAESHRSVGGTFSLSPTTGYYTRMHEGEDTYKYTVPQSADMTSPSARSNSSWSNYSSHGGKPFNATSPDRVTGRPTPQEPVEIGGTEIPQKF